MTFGEALGPGFGSSVKDSEQILDRYLELGGNFIDTANFYMRGQSEKIIGDHLAHDREKRDRVVIATKFSGNLYPGDPNGGGSNRKAVIAACEQSLRRLRTDYIDLYYLHLFDKHTPIEETVAAMHDLVQAGKVRYLGISDTPAWETAQAQLLAPFRGWAPFIALQIEHSLAERTVEGELVPMARELGLGTLEHLEDNVKALEVTLTAAQKKALDAVSAPQLPFPIPFLQGGPSVYAGGTTINGEPSQPSPILPSRRGDHH